MQEMKVATRISVGLCGSPTCQSVHIQLADERGEVFASAALGVDHIPSFIRRMQDLAYHISAGKYDCKP